MPNVWANGCCLLGSYSLDSVEVYVMANEWGRGGRRARRETARALAKEILVTQHSKAKGIFETKDLVLFFLATALTFAAALMAPKMGKVPTVLCVMAILGFLVHPLLHIPWVQRGDGRLKRITRFICVFLPTCVLAAMFGWWVFPSEPDAIGQIKNSLEQVKSNTARRAMVTVFPKGDNQALPVSLDIQPQLKLNYGFLNTGNDKARNYKTFARAYVEDGDPDQVITIEKVWKQFAAWVVDHDSKMRTGDAITTDPRGFWGTTQGPYINVSQTMLPKIQNGTLHIFLTISIPFDDDTGKYVSEGCFWMQAPANPSSPWHGCAMHGSQITRP